MAHWIAVAGIIVAAAALASSIYILTFALWGVRLGSPKSATAEPSILPYFLILIPAHNESAGIKPTILSVLAQDYPADRFRLITIADNCSDDTVSMAQQAGTHQSNTAVWPRKDIENRGKGQALAWALDRAADIHFDRVLILDADSTVAPDFLQQMAAAAATHPVNSVLQARYEFLPSPAGTAGWFETFTLASKAAENSFTYRPRSSASLVNLIQGNGFSIPRSTLATVPFRASSIVEDAEYAIELAIANVPVYLVEPARVGSRMTQNLHDAAPQRVRWARGIFQLIFAAVPRLLFQGIRQRRARLIEASLMLLLTSRVLIVLATALSFVLAVLAISQPQARIIFALAASAVLLQAVYLALMFRKSADTPFSMKGLLFMPAYAAIISFSQALALFGFRRKRWARTIR